MTDTGATRPTRGAAAPAFATRLLVVLAAATIVLAGMQSIRGIIGPIFLALVLTITLHPIRTWLESRRLPEWATSIVMLLGVYLLLILLTLALIVSAAQLAALIPQYADQIKEDAANLGDALGDLGVKEAQIDAVVHAIDPGQVVDLAMGVLSDVLGVQIGRASCRERV